MSDTESPGVKVATAAGIALYVIVGYFYLFSGLMVPVPWVVGLWIVWVLGLVAVVRWRHEHPLWVLAAPFVAMAFWVAVLWMGDTFLGWTA